MAGMADAGLSIATFHHPFDFAAGIGFSHFFSFVVNLQATAKGQFALGNTTLVEVDPQGDEGQPLFLGFPQETGQFTAVHQQLTGAFRFVVPDRGLRVLRDVTANQPKLIFLDAAVGFVELAFPRPQAFHLASSQDHAALDAIEDLVVMPYLTVLHDAAPAAGRFLWSVSNLG